MYIVTFGKRFFLQINGCFGLLIKRFKSLSHLGNTILFMYFLILQLVKLG